MELEEKVKKLEKRIDTIEVSFQGLKRYSHIVAASIFLIAVTLIVFSYRHQKIDSILEKTNQVLDNTVQVLVESKY